MPQSQPGPITQNRARCMPAALTALLLMTLAGCGSAAQVPSPSAANSTQSSPALASSSLSTSSAPLIAASPSAPAWGFASTGDMTYARAYHSATLLLDGRVLIAGGDETSEGLNPLKSAELYDPASGTFAPTGSMIRPREGQSATLLADGKVLVAGGEAAPGPQGNGMAAPWLPDASAEIYDPGTGQFARTGSMEGARAGQGAVLLRDGRVLVAGGDDETRAPLDSAELYDPGTGRFVKTGSMVTARDCASFTLLADGRVLVAGGADASGNPLDSPRRTTRRLARSPRQGR